MGVFSSWFQFSEQILYLVLTLKQPTIWHRRKFSDSQLNLNFGPKYLNYYFCNMHFQNSEMDLRQVYL